ncbi:MAG: DUF2868 domain-containing protein [Sulfurovum sp.]|nr:DUF2868 domain-containing protein [Sulfurovum sp.]
MDLKSYLNLYELLESNTSTREENRAFGLVHVLDKNRPARQLIAWEKEHRHKLHHPTMSEKSTSYLYYVTLVLSIVVFILGLFSGIALLAYSGHEPVNVIYFMSMVVFFPLLTMSLALFSMLRANRAQSLLVHTSPAFWMEKILSYLPSNIQEGMKEIKINPLLVNWIVIKRSQLIALFFSLGLFISLLAMVVTKDIAFAWSTTLDITPEVFHGFLNTLALPWRDVYPWAVPSIELIESSQYFRLGDKLSEEMIGNASKLGEWWKFLAFATIFYALILRLVMYVVSTLGYQYALKKSLISLKGASYILNNMNTPIITTNATVDEHVVSSLSKDMQYVRTLDASYDFVQGWAISTSQIVVLNDAMQVMSQSILEVGGSNTLAEDSAIAHKSFGEVLLYVKAWEPPTLDIIDYIEELAKNTKKIIVYPIGTQDEMYQSKEKFINIWIGKLSMIDNNQKIWIKIP